MRATMWLMLLTGIAAYGGEPAFTDEFPAEILPLHAPRRKRSTFR